MTKAITKNRHIDLDAMKRWFGPPPLFVNGKEDEFDEFIQSLAKCVERKDPFIEVLIYQFGIEKYKTLQLYSLRATLLEKKQTALANLEQQHNASRRRRKDGAEAPEALMAYFKKAEDSSVTRLHVLEDPVNKSRDPAMCEIDIARALENILDLYGTIDAAIDDCTTRARDISRQISVHDSELLKQLEDQMWEKIYELEESRWHARQKGCSHAPQGWPEDD